ncbi:NAD(P)-dependent dehydrogenase (short-subunit alcohol dehydrogenase family) [Allocatelliglobosispora scoriae]|uniref:NAD(P)-dependent dehydrogenase (Short-subunit alcohol dehydrogenase family) n=1 Tax=Allocatelliglobosispora scoriae TaxID=643052 RepID=A0A841BXL9_9ACTN|nr:SDR family oxidoreductase [Allocatelliglobosispora scoriae]MBB5872904.1 NAD(P)-dependent dehydrogenase (short-subunit alcohol dehydrogenase family) [Allocatelliglobosispora scoriae]
MDTDSDPRPVAAITGAAQGIGERIAQVLADEGYRLALFDRQQIPDSDSVLAITGDVTRESDVADFAAAIGERFGRIDVLVNNAGIACISPAEETPASLFRQVVDVNLTGPFLLSQALGRQMLAAGSGSIVNIASVAGLFGVADRSAYNASKHGLIGLTRTLAAEWGGRGVRVNAVCPGWVKTPMDDASQGEGAYGDADITDHVPMGRFATPDDVAQAVAFLADRRRSAFVNGVTLSVDGGWAADGSWQSLRLGARER